jgi:hypothetical protein
MTHHPHWPSLGRAAASRVAKILGHHAGWSLAQAPYDDGLPLAACLMHQPTALLITVASRDLALCAAAMEETLLAARADALIIADERGPWFPPLCAVGHWRGGTVTWHQPLLPWSADGQTIWLVPAQQVAVDDGAPAFRLVARYLKPEPVPWADERGRLAGLERASSLLRTADQ